MSGNLYNDYLVVKHFDSNASTKLFSPEEIKAVFNSQHMIWKSIRQHGENELISAGVPIDWIQEQSNCIGKPT